MTDEKTVLPAVELKSTDIHNEELWQFPMQYPTCIT
jgi:hypothetical protein